MPRDLLGELHADLLEYERSRPRAQQVESGASQANKQACRAEALLRLRGVPESDPRLSWEAWIGSAIHQRLEEIRKQDPRFITERRFTYRDILPATVDLIQVDPPPPVLVDYKTVDSVDRIPDEPKESWLHQIHVGAAAAREAGINVEEVAVIVLPRAGAFEPAQFGPYPFDQAMADEAADWVVETNALAADKRVGVEQLRDKPPYWCARFCPYVSVCRGTPTPEQPLDDWIVELAQAYDEARADRDKAKARMDEAAEGLRGLKGRVGPWSISTSGGREVVEDVEDIDALRDLWRFVQGDEMPTRRISRLTPQRLTVRKAAS